MPLFASFARARAGPAASDVPREARNALEFGAGHYAQRC
jgi:hypothetical protein